MRLLERYFKLSFCARKHNRVLQSWCVDNMITLARFIFPLGFTSWFYLPAAYKENEIKIAACRKMWNRIKLWNRLIYRIQEQWKHFHCYNYLKWRVKFLKFIFQNPAVYNLLSPSGGQTQIYWTEAINYGGNDFLIFIGQDELCPLFPILSS